MTPSEQKLAAQIEEYRKEVGALRKLVLEVQSAALRVKSDVQDLNADLLLAIKSHIASSLGNVQGKLDALPETFRAVLVMVDLADLTYREAASELGVPVGTVMSRLHRGRKLLATQLQEAA